MEKILRKHIIYFWIALMQFFALGNLAAQNPNANFTANNVSGCAPLNVAFTNTSTNAVSYIWDFGNGNTSSNFSPSNVYLNVGTFNVSLIAISESGQRDTLIRNTFIQVLTPPVSAFSIPVSAGCVGTSTFSFTNNSQSASTYFWDFGDGTVSTLANPTKTYSNPGTYNISLLATNAGGCNNLSSMPNAITVYPKPNANFLANPTQTCNINQVFQFSAVNTTASSYFWEFGDGTTSSLQNPSKTYSAAGNYNVKLKVMSAQGCIDSLVKSNYIQITSTNAGNITSNVASGCKPLAVTFSSASISNAISYQWNFGNGQTSTAANPSHTYPNEGSFNVSVTVTFPGGCSNTFQLANPITVHPQPTANFTVSNNVGCSPLTVQFNNQSQNGVSYVWEFLGSGMPISTETNPIRTYNQPGNYNVKLTTTNEFGCARSVTLNNIVQVQNPVVNFTATPTNSCPPQVVEFTSNIAGNIVSYLWDFGDGNTSTLPNPSNLYSSNGNYDVSLTVTNAAGCTQTYAIEDYINLSYAFAEYNSPDPVVGCSPLTVSYDVSTPGVTGYLWNFGDGSTSTSPSPVHSFTSPGTYQVTLLVEMDNGCSQFYPTYQTIIVEGQDPLFSVSIDPCPPYAVQFQNNGTDAIAWYWDFGDGTTSTDPNPSHLYSNLMIHHVTLTTTTAGGCSYSYIGFNAVNFEVISATFNSSFTNGPFPQVVQFTSTNPNATSWYWDFGDGNTSTEQHPTHTYQNEGNYTVTHAINSDGCFVTSTGDPFTSVSVDNEEGNPGGGGSGNPGNAPMPNPLVGCRPLTVHFFKTDTSHTVLSWNFGDGNVSFSQQPVHTYLEPGLYSVSYEAQTQTGIQTINYTQAIMVGGFIPDFDATPVASCNAIAVSLLPNIPWAETWTWTYNNQTSTEYSPVATFPNNNGAVNVTLTTRDTLGCVSSRTKSVYLSNPNPIFTYDPYSCDGNIAIQHNIPQGLDFSWDFGDGTISIDFFPTHTYINPGLYEITLKLTDDEGCEKTYTLQQKVRVTFFNSTFELDSIGNGCVPFYISFQNSSIANGPDSAAVTYTYLWSDGHSTLNPYRNLTIAGNYWVKQIASHSLLNCTDTAMISDILVYDATADFSFEQSGICLPITASFTDLSINPVSWQWDFGNGITSTLQHPILVYDSLPDHEITLNIVNVNGCTATVTKPNIYIFNANFNSTITNGCNPVTTTFSTNAEGVAFYEWDFGDGSTSNEASPVHQYTENGNFTVVLTVTSFEGCVESLVQENMISVHGPIANFYSPTPASCAPSIVEFFDSSENAVSWSWDFGDGTFSSVQNPVKLYNQPGSYDIKLIVTSENGCLDTIIMPGYTTVLGPATSFSMSSPDACSNTSITFADNSYGAVVWEWNFGEGSTSNEQHPTFTFTQSGSYTVTLFSQDSLGCTAYYVLQTPIEIYELPVAQAGISALAGCAPFTIQLSNTSTGAINYYWNFGNGDTSSDSLPNYTYQNSGIYNITLIAETAQGCRDTAIIENVTSHIVPIAAISASNIEGCTPVQVQFQNNSQNLENPSWSWNFGNNETSTLESPAMTFTQSGYYDVSLIVTNSNGCMDSITMPAMIFVYDTIAPPATEIARVTVIDETKVNISWTQTGVSDFGKYIVYRYNIHTGLYDQIAEINNFETNTYTDQGLQTLSNSYCYKVLTVDRCNYALSLNELQEHCSIDITANTHTDNNIYLNWTPYVGRNVAQYRIFRREENTLTYDDLGLVDGSITSFIDSTVICPVKYRYTVKAEKLDGLVHLNSDGDYDIAAPIQNLFENQKVTIGRSTVFNNEAILTEWAQPTVMGAHVVGYRIFRSEDNNTFYPLATVPAVQTAYVDEEVNVNTTKYYYRIMAINSCGLNGLESNFSDNVVLKAWMNDLFKTELEWTPYLGWDEGVSFYIIERQSDDGVWQLVKFVGGNVTSTVDEN